jgi:methylenetetrahydrofolate--tRNA-(uracil-5-)-methyltransferase
MQNILNKKVLVVGAGLAGVEASYFLANRGIRVVLVESKRVKKNEAQKMEDFAELVCTNSLKSIRTSSGHGMLKREMKALGSLVLEIGEETKVPAGQALAVDRHEFSRQITERLSQHPNVTIIDEIVVDPLSMAKKVGADKTILATGPLTHEGLSDWLVREICQSDLYFYDSIAPVVDADSLDYEQLYFKNRYEAVDENADYLNVPLTKEQYESFVDDLVKAEKVKPAKFEKMTYFESCLPIDLMAERGPDTLRFSCMKPVGLEERDGSRPYAVVQLRKENLAGSSFNMVGFQNTLTYGEQVRIFRKLPGFAEAVFQHLGSVHRNTYIGSYKLLNRDLSSKRFPELHFAGQIVGVEGYTESASMGLYAALQVWRELSGKPTLTWPKETAIGALIEYILGPDKQVAPSNINFGLFESLPKAKLKKVSKNEWKDLKKEIISFRAQLFLSSVQHHFH